jgi:DNA-binding response OmpR family regulator
MAETPVVFLTTSCLINDVMEARRGSANLYVVKPDTREELQQRLDAVIKRAVSGAWSR